MRFKEFECAWERKKLGEIATFTKGKGISKNDIDENGKIECIRYGELYTHYKEVITEIKSKTNIDKEQLIFSETNDVIIPSSGETQIDIATASCILKSGVALGGDLNIIKTSNDGIFLSYYLNSRKKLEIANLAQGISVVHLYASQLALLEVALPEIQEQIKIANFLRLLDERIQTQNKIIQRLETLMQGLSENLFKQQVRFKDEDGNNFPDWEQKKLGEICHVNPKVANLPTSFYYIDLESVVKGDLLKLNEVLKDNAPSRAQRLLMRDDILFQMVRPYQKNNFYFDREGDYVASTGYAQLRTKEDSKFIYYYLHYQKFVDAVIERCTGTSYPAINSTDLSNIFIGIPILSEQTKISDFLSYWNEKIRIEKTTLQHYGRQKKFLLQNMFI